MAAKIPPRKIGRDSGTGQFIPIEEARRRPKTTEIETFPAPKRHKKPKQ